MYFKMGSFVTHMLPTPSSTPISVSESVTDEPPSPEKRPFLVSAFQKIRKLFFPEKTSPESLNLPQGREDIMVMRTLHFRSLRAEDIRIPRTDIVAIDVETNYQELVKILSDCSFSRLPVYTSDMDHIIGMVRIKDILRHALNPQDFSLRSILKDVLFISPALSLRDLLIEMQTTRTHLAIVVDEFGGVDGLITLEDVIEEIVGDIQDGDEKKSEPQIIFLGDHLYLADARLTLEEFEQKTQVNLTLPSGEDDIDTLGGYVIALIDHIPSRGELIRSPAGVEFEIVEADPRKLKKLKVRLLPLPPTFPPSLAA